VLTRAAQVYKLGTGQNGQAVTLHDPGFDAMFAGLEDKAVPYQAPLDIQLESDVFDLNSAVPENVTEIEGLIGMTLRGEPLDYDRRTCSGNSQSTPAGIPGICELKKEYYVLTPDTVGMKCPVQRANYGVRRVGARCRMQSPALTG